MVGFNKILIIGNVGTDPEMRYTPSGKPVTSFRIATSRAYTTADGERHQETEWFTVVAWDQLAEQCNQYLAKGRRAFVEGRLQSKSWKGQDGQTRFQNEITANRVLFLDRSPGYQSSEGEASSAGDQPQPGNVDAEDLPF
jgi:single-strand DNA-binding protein